MKTGTISVVIPTYNHAGYIEQCLDSLFRQTRPPDEIVVINDGSPDDTGRVVKPYLDRITYVEQENQGIGRSYNRGIELSTGDYVKLLDSDDWLELDALETLATVLDEHPEVGLVHGRRIIADQHGNLYPHRLGSTFPLGKNRDTAGIIETCYVNFPTTLCRREALDQAGLFLDFELCQDWAMWICMALEGWSIYGLDQRLAFYRRHTGNITSAANRKREFVDQLAMLDHLHGKYDAQLSATEQEAFARTRRRIHQRWGWWSLAGDARPVARRSFARSLRSRVDLMGGLGLTLSVLPPRFYHFARNWCVTCIEPD